jgi:threonyl-tRNA synthetase
MIHRAPFGSMERFISILIEHTAGKLPLWLAPDQYALLPISEKPEYIQYCKKIQDLLAQQDIRGFIDDRSETIGKKIRDTELKKIPFMLIAGEKEIQSNTISVRKQGMGDLGSKSLDDFIGFFKEQLG